MLYFVTGVETVGGIEETSGHLKTGSGINICHGKSKSEAVVDRELDDVSHRSPVQVNSGIFENSYLSFQVTALSPG